MNGAPVIASDGTVSANGDLIHPYTSIIDSNFTNGINSAMSSAPSGIELLQYWFHSVNNNGWVVYQNGSLVPDYTLGKKLYIWEMIEKLREKGYICSI